MNRDGYGYLVLATIIFPVTKRDQPHLTSHVPMQTDSQLTGQMKAFSQANSELPNFFFFLVIGNSRYWLLATLAPSWP